MLLAQSGKSQGFGDGVPRSVTPEIAVPAWAFCVRSGRFSLTPVGPVSAYHLDYRSKPATMAPAASGCGNLERPGTTLWLMFGIPIR